MRARDPLTPLAGFRLVASPASLDAMTISGSGAGPIVLRVAPDEVLGVFASDEGGLGAMSISDDPDRLFTVDNSWHGVWVEPDAAMDLLERHADWEPPNERPAFAQGLVAGLPVKVWWSLARVLFVVPATFGVDFEERVR